MPATLLYQQLPSHHRRAIDIDSFQQYLRNSSSFDETSPGMFAATTGAKKAALTTLDATSPGVAIDALLVANPTPDADSQREAFKRHAGLLRLAQLPAEQPWPDVLTAEIDALAPTVMTETGWSTRDVMLFASGPGKLVPVGDDERAARRSQLLRAIRALDLCGNGERDELPARLQDSRDILARANLALVAFVARKYAHLRFLQYADLFQEGVPGLLRAIEKYDPYLGFEFSTYATQWIRQSITRAIANQETLVRVPVHARNEWDQVRQTFAQSGGGSSLELKLFAVERGMGRETVEAVSRASAPVVRMAPGHLGSSTYETPGLEEGLVESSLADALRAVVSRLSPREQSVITFRFGLDGEGERTLQQVGEIFGVTRERIRQIEAKAMRKLRGGSTLAALSDYMQESPGEGLQDREEQESVVRPRRHLPSPSDPDSPLSDRAVPHPVSVERAATKSPVRERPPENFLTLVLFTAGRLLGDLMLNTESRDASSLDLGFEGFTIQIRVGSISGVPSVFLTVLLEEGRPAVLSACQEALPGSDRITSNHGSGGQQATSGGVYLTHPLDRGDSAVQWTAETIASVARAVARARAEDRQAVTDARMPNTVSLPDEDRDIWNQEPKEHAAQSPRLEHDVNPDHAVAFQLQSLGEKCEALRERLQGVLPPPLVASYSPGEDFVLVPLGLGARALKVYPEKVRRGAQVRVWLREPFTTTIGQRLESEVADASGIGTPRVQRGAVDYYLIFDAPSERGNAPADFDWLLQATVAAASWVSDVVDDPGVP